MNDKEEEKGWLIQMLNVKHKKKGYIPGHRHELFKCRKDLKNNPIDQRMKNKE